MIIVLDKKLQGSETCFDAKGKNAYEPAVRCAKMRVRLRPAGPHF
jgi:hypothetical protein